MNDKIKEILDSIKEQSEEENWIQLSPEFIQPLLDYITNLQQDLANYVNVILHGRNVIDDYKSRVEKAVEYIKYNDDSLYTFEPDYDYEENLVDNYEPSSFREDLLNILQNGSESK